MTLRMRPLSPCSFSDAAISLREGGIGVVPTDTIYGLVASAFCPESIERLYRVRKRDTEKPCIVLLSDERDLERFGVRVPERVGAFLRTVWPGKVSVIFSGIRDEFSHLHRGTRTVAFRVPEYPALSQMLRVSGPIIAPSANRQGEKPAETLEDAQGYFGGAVDFFVDGGLLRSLPSTVVSCDGDRIKLIRSGAVEIPRQAL